MQAHGIAEVAGRFPDDRWQVIHREFFGREAAENGFVFDGESLVVLERFEVLALRSQPSAPKVTPKANL